MSETALPKDEAQPALDAPGQTPVTAPRRGNGLAIVALLLGLSSITVPWATLITSVVLYIVIPVAIAQALQAAGAQVHSH